MKILHVIPSYVPALRYGGPILATHGLCQALTSAGHDVTVCTTNMDGAAASTVPTGEPVDVDGVTVWYFRVPLIRRLAFSPGLGSWLARSARDFDVLHVHSMFSWPTLIATHVARRAAVPYVLTPRGALARELVRRRSRRLKRLWLAAVDRRSLEGAAAVHATTEAERAEFEHLGFGLPPVRVIPNGVEASASAPVTSRQADTVLYLGRLSWEKGLDRLIPALRWAPRARLAVVGEGEPAYVDRLRALAVDNGVADRVDFKGALYGAGKEAALRSCALLVLPSYSENFGNVVLEAWAASTPVIVTREVGLAPEVEAAGAGSVVAGDAQALGEAIAAQLDDSALRAAMGRAGRQVVETRYAWPRIAAAMGELYHDVRHGHP